MEKRRNFDVILIPYVLCIKNEKENERILFYCSIIPFERVKSVLLDREGMRLFDSMKVAFLSTRWMMDAHQIRKKEKDEDHRDPIDQQLQ